jgi:putative ABC transport system permease protein
MRRVALRGLASRKLRSALTAVAIVLGVALVAGTYVLTDSISGAFGSIFQTVYRGTDATVTGRNAIDSSATGGGGNNQSPTPSFSQTLLARVQRLPDVQDALGGVAGSPQLVKNGKAITFGGAPNLGFSVDPSKPQFNSLKLVSGSWPGPNDVVIDIHTASKKRLRAGDTIGVQAQGPEQRMRISGLVKFGSAGSLGGATLAGFQLATAQRLFEKVGKLDDIRTAAKPGTSPQALVSQIRTVLPPGTQVRTGAQQAQKAADSTNSFLSFLKTFLLAFGGIALFVGSFVIANSLSITIAQRTREFATLRTLGASRRQVLRAILVESLAVGVAASVIGVLVGLGLAKGLFALFDAVGFTLPNSGILVKARTVEVALIVGVLVTLLASLRPALRATRVEPIAAVREGAVLPEGRLAKYRTKGSLAATVLGFASLALGLFVVKGTAAVLTWMGLGALLIFVGIALLSSRVVVPLASGLGWPATRIAGAVGRIARENARRNPQRTASTASALMIGLALVTLVAILSAGIISNFKGAVNALFTGDYAVTAQNNFSPVPTAAGLATASAPAVTAVGNVRAGEGRVFGHNEQQLTAVDPGVRQVIKLDWKHGSQAVLSALGADGAFTTDSYASKHHLSLGSPVVLTTPNGARVNLVVKGIFKPPAGGSPFGVITISAATWDRFYPQPQNLFTFVKTAGGETAANQAALRRTLAAFPNAKVQTRQKFIDNQISALKGILNILYVLLALSIIVSLFGIVNTLVLSVFERTREIGMLRAVGMTRRQVRRMVRHESVITALIGSVIGIALGIVLGALLASRVDFIAFTLPVGSLIAFVITSWIVGLLAAILPARRAARLKPLDALSYE